MYTAIELKSGLRWIINTMEFYLKSTLMKRSTLKMTYDMNVTGLNLWNLQSSLAPIRIFLHVSSENCHVD